MSTVNFDNLDLIPELVNYIKELKDEIHHIKSNLVPKLDLTKRDGVKKYLGISDSTIAVMMNDGRLRQGIHFTKELKGSKPKITFIESAIKELKAS